MVRLALLAISAVQLTACAASPFSVQDARPASDVRCEQRTEHVFAIVGEIDGETAECVRSQLRQTTRLLVLNSSGGSLEAALDIAERLEGRALAMHIDGECNSACANYLLPLASRITQTPGSVVLLHGGADTSTAAYFEAQRADFMVMMAREGLYSGVAAERFEALLRQTRMLQARQDDFVRRNNVPRGWLLQREAGSGRVAGLTRQPPRAKAILVEEAMMRSCLTNVDVAPYQQDLNRQLGLVARVRMLAAGVAPSGRIECSTVTDANGGA